LIFQFNVFDFLTSLGNNDSPIFLFAFVHSVGHVPLPQPSHEILFPFDVFCKFHDFTAYVFSFHIIFLIIDFSYLHLFSILVTFLHFSDCALYKSFITHLNLLIWSSSFSLYLSSSVVTSLNVGFVSMNPASSQSYSSISFTIGSSSESSSVLDDWIKIFFELVLICWLIVCVEIILSQFTSLFVW
jgi:hypothetical protein